MYKTYYVDHSSEAKDYGAFMNKHVVLKGNQTRILNNLLKSESENKYTQILAEMLGAGKTFIVMALLSHGLMPEMKGEYLPTYTEVTEKQIEKGNKCPYPPVFIIPQNVIICTQSMVKQWTEHLEQFTKFKVFVINNINAVVTLANLLAAGEFAQFDVIVISDSMSSIKNHGKELRWTLSGSSKDAKYSLVHIAQEQFKGKFQSSKNLNDDKTPIFARVIYDDFNDLPNIQKNNTLCPIGQSNILVSSTYKEAKKTIPDLSNGDKPIMRFGTDNNIFDYAGSYAKWGGPIPVHMSEPAFYDQIAQMPGVRVIKHNIVSSNIQSKLFKQFQQTSPDMAEKLMAYAIDTDVNAGDQDMGYFLATMLVLPKLEYQEADKTIRQMREKLITEQNGQVILHTTDGPQTFGRENWPETVKVYIQAQNRIVDYNADLLAYETYKHDARDILYNQLRKRVRAVNKQKKNKEQVYSEECPICCLSMDGSDVIEEGDDPYEHIYVFSCCGMSICEYCKEDCLNSNCPNPECTEKNPRYYKINLNNMENIEKSTNFNNYNADKDDGNTITYGSKFDVVIDNVLGRNRKYKNVQTAHGELSELLHKAVGLCVGKDYVAPPQDKKIFAIIANDESGINNLRDRLMQNGIDTVVMNAHNAYKISTDKEYDGKVVLINTVSLRAGINLPHITDLFIMHKYHRNDVFSQAMGRFQRITRKYSLTVHQIFAECE